jgi:hypothetical protein
MNLTYSPLLSAAFTAALQARERYVLAALKSLPLEGSFRWSTSATADGTEYITLRHASAEGRCIVWFTRGEVQRKFTEERIATLIRAQTRTVPGQGHA